MSVEKKIEADPRGTPVGVVQLKKIGNSTRHDFAKGNDVPA